MSIAMFLKLPIIVLTCDIFSSISSSRASLVILKNHKKLILKNLGEKQDFERTEITFTVCEIIVSPILALFYQADELGDLVSKLIYPGLDYQDLLLGMRLNYENWDHIDSLLKPLKLYLQWAYLAIYPPCGPSPLRSSITLCGWLFTTLPSSFPLQVPSSSLNDAPLKHKN